MDLSNQKEMYDYRINQGLDHGMTPYEMFMGPAAGAGGGTTGSGSTLGNSQTSRDMQTRQLQITREENAANRQTQLAQTQMQTNAQLESAKIQAGVGLAKSLGTTYMSNKTTERGQDINSETSRRGQDISSETSKRNVDIQTSIQKGQLDLSERQFKQVTLPQAAKQLNLTEYQTQKALNDVATSDPKFVLAMKRLTMGVDNLYVEGLIKQFGVDPTKSQPEWDKIPVDKRAALMAALDIARSTTAKEGSGLAAVFERIVDAANNDTNKRKQPPPKQPMSQPPLGKGSRTLTAPGGVSHPFQ